MDGNVNDPWDIACQQRDGNGDIEQHIGQGAVVADGKGFQQQDYSESNEKISKFVRMHKNHILGNLYYNIRHGERRVLLEEMVEMLLSWLMVNGKLSCDTYGRYTCRRK